MPGHVAFKLYDTYGFPIDLTADIVRSKNIKVDIKSFEKEMAEFSQCNHAVGVGNGSDALHLALRALEVGPGDEVITTPFTFIATVASIVTAGAKPVFVDIKSDYNIDEKKINLDGGAIALGHPLGATGARITGKVAELLRRENKRYALATQCIGLGMGIATVIESVN